jgi:hypothetical protein
MATTSLKLQSLMDQQAQGRVLTQQEGPGKGPALMRKRRRESLTLRHLAAFQQHCLQPQQQRSVTIKAITALLVVVPAGLAAVQCVCRHLRLGVQLTRSHHHRPVLMRARQCAWRELRSQLWCTFLLSRCRAAHSPGATSCGRKLWCWCIASASGLGGAEGQHPLQRRHLVTTCQSLLATMTQDRYGSKRERKSQPCCNRPPRSVQQHKNSQPVSMSVSQSLLPCT